MQWLIEWGLRFDLGIRITPNSSIDSPKENQLVIGANKGNAIVIQKRKIYNLNALEFLNSSRENVLNNGMSKILNELEIYIAKFQFFYIDMDIVHQQPFSCIESVSFLIFNKKKNVNIHSLSVTCISIRGVGGNKLIRSSTKLARRGQCSVFKVLCLKFPFQLEHSLMPIQPVYIIRNMSYFKKEKMNLVYIFHEFMTFF